MHERTWADRMDLRSFRPGLFPTSHRLRRLPRLARCASVGRAIFVTIRRIILQAKVARYTGLSAEGLREARKPVCRERARIFVVLQWKGWNPMNRPPCSGVPRVTTLEELVER